MVIINYFSLLISKTRERERERERERGGKRIKAETEEGLIK
jgi:hypothetical protein